MLYCWGGETGRRTWGQELGENGTGCGEGCRAGTGCRPAESHAEREEKKKVHGEAGRRDGEGKGRDNKVNHKRNFTQRAGLLNGLASKPGIAVVSPSL